MPLYDELGGDSCQLSKEKSEVLLHDKLPEIHRHITAM